MCIKLPGQWSYLFFIFPLFIFVKKKKKSHDAYFEFSHFIRTFQHLLHELYLFDLHVFHMGGE